MILITGGTGFIGQILARHLVNMGKPVRVLLRPSLTSPNLPRGVPVEVAVCSLKDERGLRAALKGIDVVYHLAGSERQGIQADLEAVDIQGTNVLSHVAAQVGVERFIYLSHLGADRASAYPVLKAKGIAENFILRSGVDYTIFRSGVVYGPNDQFSTVFANLIRKSPGVFWLPDKGRSMLQPIWVEDLVTCMTWCLEDSNTNNQVYQVGGGEYISFRQVIETIIKTIKKPCLLLTATTPYLRYLSVWLSQIYPAQSIPIFWLDYLATDRTCAVDALPRLFGLIPARFTQNIEYLKIKPVSPQSKKAVKG
jgi:NADH dehydrogenase